MQTPGVVIAPGEFYLLTVVLYRKDGMGLRLREFLAIYVLVPTFPLLTNVSVNFATKSYLVTRDNRKW